MYVSQQEPEIRQLLAKLSPTALCWGISGLTCGTPCNSSPHSSARMDTTKLVRPALYPTQRPLSKQVGRELIVTWELTSLEEKTRNWHKRHLHCELKDGVPPGSSSQGTGNHCLLESYSGAMLKKAT